MGHIADIEPLKLFNRLSQCRVVSKVLCLRILEFGEPLQAGFGAVDGVHFVGGERVDHVSHRQLGGPSRHCVIACQEYAAGLEAFNRIFKQGGPGRLVHP